MRTKLLGLFGTLIGAAILALPLSASAWEGGNYRHDGGFRAPFARVDRNHDRYYGEHRGWFDARSGHEREEHEEREEWLEHHRGFERGTYGFWSGYRPEGGYYRYYR